MLIFKKNFKAIAVISSLFLAGCSTLGKAPQSDSNAQQIAKESATEEAQTRPFDRETLYDLLVAEFAGKRNRADVALGKYLKQAHKSRDPAVTARATLERTIRHRRDITSQSSSQLQKLFLVSPQLRLLHRTFRHKFLPILSWHGDKYLMLLILCPWHLFKMRAPRKSEPFNYKNRPRAVKRPQGRTSPDG